MKKILLSTAIFTAIVSSCSEKYDIKDINTNPERKGSLKALTIGENENHNYPDSVRVNFSDYQQEGTSAWAGNVAINKATEVTVKGGKHKVYGYSWKHTSDAQTISTETAPMKGKIDTFFGEIEADNKVEVALEATGALVIVPTDCKIVYDEVGSEAKDNTFFETKMPNTKGTYLFVNSKATNMGTEITHEPREYRFIIGETSVKQTIEAGKTYIFDGTKFKVEKW